MGWDKLQVLVSPLFRRLFIKSLVRKRKNLKKRVYSPKVKWKQAKLIFFKYIENPYFKFFPDVLMEDMLSKPCAEFNCQDGCYLQSVVEKSQDSKMSDQEDHDFNQV